MTNKISDESEDSFGCQIPVDYRGWRLDQALAALFPDYSRSCLQQWIRDRRVHVDGQISKPRTKLYGGEQVVVSPDLSVSVDCEPQAIEFNVVYEDEHLLVIDKPAGLVMHPAPGNRDGTVQNGLLYRDSSLAQVPRAGIVHRLDKDTTGLFVVARTLPAHTSLVAQLQAHSVHREYRALVSGVLVAGGVIDAPIGRHPKDRKRMAVVVGGKPAVTHFRVLEKFRAHSYLRLQLETGRTHQIRVHMAHRRYPLIGDAVYAGRLRVPAAVNQQLATGLREFSRQALHATCLSVQHPNSNREMLWRAPLPDDFENLLALLRADSADTP